MQARDEIKEPRLKLASPGFFSCEPKWMKRFGVPDFPA